MSKRPPQSRKKATELVGDAPATFRRAVWDQDKQVRRQSLLDSAGRLFSKHDFENISVQDICTGAGVAKGTFYLYFATKEAVFLALEAMQISGWLEDVEAAIQKLPAKANSGQICEVFVSTISQRPDFASYLSILHHVLEKNVGEEEIVEFKFFLKNRLNQTATLLAKHIDSFTGETGMQTLIFIHTCIVGGWQMANPTAVMRKVLERPEMAEFRINFVHLLNTFLGAYLRGIMSR